MVERKSNAGYIPAGYGEDPEASIGGVGNLSSIMDLFESPKVQSQIAGDDSKYNESWMSPDTRDAALSGARAGGLSGALVSGGIASENPYAIGGGLILSQIEAKNLEDQRAQAQYEEDKKSQQKDLLGLARERARQVYKV